MTSKSSLSTGPCMVAVVVSLFLLIVATAAPAARQGQIRQVVTVIAPTALEPLLPAAIDGWTKIRSISYRVNDGCAYAFADALFVNGDAKLRVTVADTGFDADALMAVATIVRSFPAGHTETIPPDTVISRITYHEYPAATMWNSAKGEAESTVVVNDRFVAKVEGTRVDSLETLRGVLDKIDLKKLAELGK